MTSGVAPRRRSFARAPDDLARRGYLATVQSGGRAVRLTGLSRVNVAGGLAEWLGSGLQSRVQRFESATRLGTASQVDHLIWRWRQCFAHRLAGAWRGTTGEDSQRPLGCPPCRSNASVRLVPVPRGVRYRNTPLVRVPDRRQEEFHQRQVGERDLQDDGSVRRGQSTCASFGITVEGLIRPRGPHRTKRTPWAVVQSCALSCSMSLLRSRICS